MAKKRDKGKKRSTLLSRFSSFRSKLSAKQAMSISFIITCFEFIVWFIMGISKNSEMQKEEYLAYWVFVAVLSLATWTILYYFVFFGYNKETQAKEELVKVKVIQQLSDSDFKQVDPLFDKEFQYGEYNSFAKMIIGILANEGCAFYAKLKGKDSVILYVIDKHQEIVFGPRDIFNFDYFDEHFKLHE